MKSIFPLNVAGPSSAVAPLPVHDARHVNNFNLLRLLFALLVIVSHTPELLDGNRDREILTNIFHTVSFGEFAVDGFFLISGYLIVQSWQTAPSVWRFVKKRLLRIFPAFVVVSIICASVVGPLAAGPEYFSEFRIAKFVKGLLTLDVPQVPPVFKGTHYAFLNGSMWTIRFEFVCYLAVLGMGMLGMLRHRIAWLLIATVIFVINAFHNFGFQVTSFGLSIRLHHPIVRLSMFFSQAAAFISIAIISCTPRDILYWQFHCCWLPCSALKQRKSHWRRLELIYYSFLLLRLFRHWRVLIDFQMFLMAYI